MTDEEFILSVTNKRVFDQDEKTRIKTLAESNNLTISFGRWCNDCYRDAVLLLYRKYRHREGKKTANGKYTYLLDKTMLVTIGGRSFVCDNMTDEKEIEILRDALKSEFQRYYKQNF